MKTKHYTSIKMSKELLNLGLNPDTADMWWIPLNWQLTEYYVEVKQDGIGTPKNPLPCWSLGALLELIPNYQLQTQNKNIGILFSCRKEIKIIEASTPIEAAFQMVVWLLKNNYIKNEKQQLQKIII